MKPKRFGWFVGIILLAVPSIAWAATIQSNVVTVTAGHYVQTGTQQVPETVTVPQQQCQNVQVQTGTQQVPETVTVPEQQCQTVQVQTGTATVQVVSGSGSCFMGSVWQISSPSTSMTNYDTCPSGAVLTIDPSIGWSYAPGYTGTLAWYDYTTYTTEIVPVYTTEQQCQTVYVQQTQYVTEPVYTTEQQCQTVYVQQTQYVMQPVYSWVPTSVSQ
ncbi:MAG: hypothetical protein K6T31_03740 [Alicyclobacillus sp.]|nr:hypothetical protein [Alicyclobacillus sp.]